MVSSNLARTASNPIQPMIYQIRIQGHLGRQCRNWFEDMIITLEENGDTLLTGPVVDQAALHGLIKKVRDLGMPLLLVQHVEPGAADDPDFIMQRINIVQQKESKNE